MHNLPIFFNCYPDFYVDLSCPMTPEALKLDVHVQVDEFHDFKNFAIMYRVYFRLMCPNLNTTFLSTLPSNSKETILLQIEDDKPQVFTPKLLKWDEITIAEAIQLEDAQSTFYDKSKQMNNIKQTIEEPDGIVLFRFHSSREPTNLLGTSPSRKSFSDFHSDRGIPTKKPQNYLFRCPIVEPVINDPLSSTSPAIGHGYNVLTNPNFTIDWPFFKKDYYSPSNASMRQWFEKLIETLEKRSTRNGLLTCKSGLTHFHGPLFESTKLNGGMSAKPNSEEKKM